MYKPEQKNACLLNLVIAGCAMLAVAAYFGALAVQSYRWIFQIAIILSATAALFLWSRYTLTWFAYLLRQRENGDGGEELVVFKGQGRKEGVMEALLPLDALIEVIPVHRGTPVDVKKNAKDWKSYARSRYLDCTCYDYTKTFLWQDATLYIFHYGGAHSALLMETAADLRSNTYENENANERQEAEE